MRGDSPQCGEMSLQATKETVSVKVSFTLTVSYPKWINEYYLKKAKKQIALLTFNKKINIICVNISNSGLNTLNARPQRGIPLFVCLKQTKRPIKPKCKSSVCLRVIMAQRLPITCFDYFSFQFSFHFKPILLGNRKCLRARKSAGIGLKPDRVNELMI